ncbi:MFS transporter [Modestobacter sp. VKM Ac-2986]|uniref:MFS transporter n=1 Tax=Modestobacter sp. VKM Ac-2986 TaxID=3004140 RepID=UPI0022AA2D93|nr:MFS transporter [Modestobacter sp. VKM Ac-2986]MCZ2828855.1 MFS transporter [Modestobacter sp. VKM Ac-2986]
MLGALTSSTGIWMLRLGQTLTLLQVPGVTGWSVGALAALQTAPLIVLAPVVGLLSDRVHRLRLLVVGQLSMAGVAVVEAWSSLTGRSSVTQSLVLAAVLGCAAALDHPVRTSAVADLVAVPDLPRAVGSVVLTTQLGRVLGPAACAALTAVRGTSAVFLACIGLFLAFAAVLLTGVRQGRSPSRAGGGFRAARRALREDPTLLVVLWFVGCGGLVGPNLTTLATLTVGLELGGGALEVSAAALALAVGAVIGAGATSIGRRGPTLRSVGVATAACGVTAAASGAAPSHPVYLGALVLCGATALFMASQAGALVQVRVPEDVRGLVTALFSVALIAGVPVGAPLMGWGADVLGPRLTAGVSGLLVVCGALAGAAYLRWGPARRRRPA